MRALYVLLLGLLLGSQGANAQNCAGSLVNLTNGSNADASQVMANFNMLLNCINSLPPPSPSGTATPRVRQTVSFGPISGGGAPSFLPGSTATLAIATSGITASAPLIVTAANGYDPVTAAPRDLVGKATSNLTWNNLQPNKTNYLYVLIDASGLLTTGSTDLPPIYQKGGSASIANKQFTFNFGIMRGNMGNDSTAPQAYIVFVGEVVTTAGGVASALEYAYGGYFESSYTNTLPAGATLVTRAHNLGVVPSYADLRVQCIAVSGCEGGYALGDEIGLGSLHASDGTIRLPALSAGRLDADIISSSTTPWISLNKTSGGSAGTPINLIAANWKYKVVASRGW